MRRSEDLHTVKIETTVKCFIPSNSINVSIDLGSCFATREECVEDYNRLLEIIRKALIDAGIKKEEIKNSEYKVAPHMERAYKKDKDGDYCFAKYKPDGFEYMATMGVRLKISGEEPQRIWTALNSCGEEVTINIEFAPWDENDVRNELMKEAEKKGRREAELLATAAGSKVKGILIMEYTEDRYNRSPYYCCSDISYASAPSAPNFNPEETEISCSVSVIREME